jgi:hypothetical protein
MSQRHIRLTTAFLAAIALTAPGGSAATGPVSGADASTQVAALAAMSGAERRAALAGMSAAARGAVYAQARQRWGSGGRNPGVYRGGGFPVSGGRLLPRRVVGTIAYDSGFPSTGFGGGNIVGNRFNTHTGVPVLASGTVSTIQAQVAPGTANTTSSAGFVLLGPQTVGGGAMALFSTFTNATGVIDSLTFPGIGVSYPGSSFFVLFGDFASVYIPVFGPGTTQGQGHHGVVGYTGGMGPNITGTSNLGGLNSFIRATGNIVPVELMEFDVQ